MALEMSLGSLSEDLEDFQITLEAIDMESVKEETAKRAAREMSKMVRQAVFESSINSPAKSESDFEAGTPPALVMGDAWRVGKRNTGEYFVLPHPNVRQRAIVLNYGYPGKITPNDSEFLKFKVEGEPVWAKEVDGPEATGYWQKAIRRMKDSDKLDEIAREELNKEVERNT